jgi:two-component system sensor histidine kinase/response regulator
MNCEPLMHATAAAEHAEPNILVVDDTAGNRRLYATILREIGAYPMLAASGAEALEMIADCSFAMILLDVHLPDINGFELAHRIRNHGGCREVPIVFVSAVYTRDSDAFRGYALGAVDYLLAPVVPDILRAKAQVFITLQRSQHELQQYAAQLAAAHSALKDAYGELESFSYSVSHDLRNPLHAMDGLTRLLLQDPTVPAGSGTHELIEGIASAAQRMNLLIENLMQLSRVSRGEVQETPVDLTAIANDIAAELARRHPARPVQWQIAPDLRAVGDQGLLHILLSNLVGNAWKYSAQREPARIRFDATQQQGQTVFYVQDNGAGFDPQLARDRLFKPFRRLHGAHEFEGSGIGLATAQRIVRRHHGRLWAEAQVDRGATFFFTLHEESAWRPS